MKALHYCTLVYLLIGTCIIQAMHNQTKPLIPTKEQRTQAQAMRESLICKLARIFLSDMNIPEVASALADFNEKNVIRWFPKVKPHQVSYSATIIRHLPQLDPATAKILIGQCKFDRSCIIKTTKNHLKGKVQNKTDRVAIEQILLNEAGGIEHLAQAAVGEVDNWLTVREINQSNGYPRPPLLIIPIKK